MSTDNRKYFESTLDWMIRHCENIEMMKPLVPDKESFISDVRDQYAFSNALAQIGENAKRIDLWLESHNDYNWDEVIGFRDLVDHHYSALDFSTVWDIVVEDVPGLLVLLIRIREEAMCMPDEEFKVLTSRDIPPSKNRKARLFRFKKSKYRWMRTRPPSYCGRG